MQTCIVHPIRHSLRFVPDKHRRQVARDLEPVFTAVDAVAANKTYRRDGLGTAMAPLTARRWRSRSDMGRKP